MKLACYPEAGQQRNTFSALGRAVWDETWRDDVHAGMRARLSVLSVEPYGMKLRLLKIRLIGFMLSVLSVEPYGMKQC